MTYRTKVLCSYVVKVLGEELVCVISRCERRVLERSDLTTCQV